MYADYSEHLKYCKDYYVLHRDKILKERDNYRETHKEQILQARIQDKDKDKERQKKYNKEHKEERKISRIKYVSENKDKLNIYQKKYDKTLNGKYRQYKSSAKARNIPWGITKKQFTENFWQKPDYYTGLPILTVGIDRIDNTKGYTIENSVCCCEICNLMKLNYTQQEFIGMCKLVSEKHGTKLNVINGGI